MNKNLAETKILLKNIAVAESCLCFNLRKTTRVITQLYDNAMKPIGLNGTQFSLLVAITTIGAPTIALLAKVMQMDRTTLTRNIKPLEKQSLLTIKAGKDQRTRIVTLTTSGKNRLLEAIPLWEKTQKSVLEEFGQKRWASMTNDLKQLISISQKE